VDYHESPDLHHRPCVYLTLNLQAQLPQPKMEFARRLMTRDANTTASETFTPSVTNLLLALFTLVVFALVLVGVLYILRRRQAAKGELLPTHQKGSNHGRLTITAIPYGAKTDSKHVYDEKQTLIEGSSSPPDSPVPEIRITFPDEEDHCGKKKNGRVVIVRIGETGSVGMEPVSQERLPPYQSNDEDRFQSLDLERIGGLKEKNEPRRWS
jgi:hypothetical protein